MLCEDNSPFPILLKELSLTERVFALKAIKEEMMERTRSEEVEKHAQIMTATMFVLIAAVGLLVSMMGLVVGAKYLG